MTPYPSKAVEKISAPVGSFGTGTKPCFVLLAAVVSAGTLIGCSASHRFTLSNIEELSIGTSTRAEVEAKLGKPMDSGFRLPHQVYRSWQTETQPPYGLALLSWPVFWWTSSEEYVVAARYDNEELLRELSLSIDGSSRAFILLLIQPHLLAPRLEPGRLDQLRRLEAKGVKVSIEAYFGKLSVEEYAQSFRSQDGAPENSK